MVDRLRTIVIEQTLHVYIWDFNSVFVRNLYLQFVCKTCCVSAPSYFFQQDMVSHFFPSKARRIYIGSYDSCLTSDAVNYETVLNQTNYN